MDVEKEERRGKPSRKPPNTFVAVQIKCPQIHKAARDFQRHLCSAKPALLDFVVSVATMHLTLLVLRTEEETDSVERAKRALERSHAHFVERFQTSSNTLPEMVIRGVDHFDGGRVVFGKVHNKDAQQSLKYMADHVYGEFAKEEFSFAGWKGFKPHITFMKYKWDKQCQMKRVPVTLFKSHREYEFGRQGVFSIQLLHMHKEKDTTSGYYHTLHELFFDGAVRHDDSYHGECCSPLTRDELGIVGRLSECSVDEDTESQIKEPAPKRKKSDEICNQSASPDKESTARESISSREDINSSETKMTESAGSTSHCVAVDSNVLEENTTAAQSGDLTQVAPGSDTLQPASEDKALEEQRAEACEKIRFAVLDALGLPKTT